MPGIVTHHLFGEDLHARFKAVIGDGRAQREAFLLGNMGPDPLFCLKAFPKLDYRNIGTTMHSRKPDELVSAMHAHFIGPKASYARVSTSGRIEAQKTYALGFLCHYLLDSTVHPLVYAQQYALVDEVGLDVSKKQRGRTVHALIETELDEYMLSKRGMTVETFVPHKETLVCPADVLGALSRRVGVVVGEIYEMLVPATMFSSSVLMYRAAQATLDAGRDGVRSVIDYARLAKNRYSHIQALTHSVPKRANTTFANSDHTPWPHPFEQGAVVSESFDELYEHAFARACNLIPRFAQPDFPQADCRAITNATNFYGQRV